MRRDLPAAVLLAGFAIFQVSSHAQGELVGVQDPAWSPDGKRIAVSYFDRIWTMTPDGKQPKQVAADPRSGGAISRRDHRARAGLVA